MAPAPLVSVVTSVYQGEPYLASSLESILRQGDVDFELILVDDGSTDGSAEILAQLARRDARVRVLSQERQGLTRALTRACTLARGEFIARHDADDVTLPRRLAVQAALLRADARLALVSCWTRVIGPRGEPLFDVRHESRGEEATRLLLEGQDGPHHGSVMFRRELYARAGGYRPAFRFAQDWDLWLRLVDFGLIGYAPEWLYAFRVSANSISASRREQQRRLALVARASREARQRGASEAEPLAEAERISAEPAPVRKAWELGISYFVGKCLLDRRDRRALPYLRHAVRAQPWNPKPWLAMSAAWIACRRENSESIA